MATPGQPTNERIVAMLDEILRGLSELKDRQQQLASEFARIGKTR